MVLLVNYKVDCQGARLPRMVADLHIPYAVDVMILQVQNLMADRIPWLGQALLTARDASSSYSVRGPYRSLAGSWVRPDVCSARSQEGVKIADRLKSCM